MKKKAFTLIELLAVIIILAIVALIATPMVLDVIEDSKKSAAKSSTAAVLDAAKLYYAENYFKNGGSFSGYECSYNNKTGCDELELDGDKPNSGTITLGSNGMVNGKIVYGNYTFYICNNKILETEDSSCDYVDYEQIYAITDSGMITGFKTTEEVTLFNVIIPVVNAASLTPEATDYIKNKEITIPEYVGNVEVTGVSENAFSAYDIDVITILPKKELVIEQNAFPSDLNKMYVQSEYKDYYKDYAEEVVEIKNTTADKPTVHIPTVNITKSVVENQNVLTAVVDMTTLVGNHSFEWYKNNTIIENETKNTLTINEVGTYKVKVTYEGQTSYSNEITINSYTISYNLNGGEGSIENTLKLEDINISITSIVPTKSGSKFIGWGINASDTTATYTSGATYTKNENIILYAIWEEPKLCRRATTLHTEICSLTGTNGCIAAGYSKGSTITYGSLGTAGVLKSGDAFDCDVNGDGTYDATTERFYYVSDLYNTTNKIFDSNYAVLIYYNNYYQGKPNNTSLSLVEYDSSNENWHGPRTAKNNLPTATQWSNISLSNTSRAILANNGDTFTAGGNLPTKFNYSGYVARLLTVQELTKACDITGISYVDGELDQCAYLMENTNYSNKDAKPYWLENPFFGSEENAWYVKGSTRYVYYFNTNHTSIGGTRPVIDVLKTDISY